MHPGLLLALGGLLLALGCSTLGSEAPPPGESQLRKLDLTYNGLRRHYRLHVSARTDATTPAPLVVVLHGGFSNARTLERRSRWSELADREGFHVIYPNGIGLFGQAQHWNAGFCCGQAARQEIDDVGVVAAAIDDTSAVLTIDPTRIYMTGFSNGAMLTYRFAAERTEMLAAIAPVAGTIGGRPEPDAPPVMISTPREALPVIIFHGVEDPRIAYDGGVGNGRKNGRHDLAVSDAATFWADRNGCAPTPIRSELFGGRVLHDRWPGCNDGADVELFSIEGWAHRWPGPMMMKKRAPDDPLRELDASEIIWKFFARHRREGVGSSENAAPTRSSDATQDSAGY